VAVRKVGPTKSNESPKKGPEKSFYVTPGKILTPARGLGDGNDVFKLMAPAMRGAPKEPGSEPYPMSSGRVFKGGNALKAFGLQGGGKNEK
jgi:hypothetical protein